MNTPERTMDNEPTLPSAPEKLAARSLSAAMDNEACTQDSTEAVCDSVPCTQDSVQDEPTQPYTDSTIVPKVLVFNPKVNAYLAARPNMSLADMQKEVKGFLFANNVRSPVQSGRAQLPSTLEEWNQRYRFLTQQHRRLVLARDGLRPRYRDQTPAKLRETVRALKRTMLLPDAVSDAYEGEDLWLLYEATVADLREQIADYATETRKLTLNPEFVGADGYPEHEYPESRTPPLPAGAEPNILSTFKFEDAFALLSHVDYLLTFHNRDEKERRRAFNKRLAREYEMERALRTVVAERNGEVFMDNDDRNAYVEGERVYAQNEQYKKRVFDDGWTERPVVLKGSAEHPVVLEDSPVKRARS